MARRIEHLGRRPDSTIRPSHITCTSVATFLAKAMACVTTSIVWPVFARSEMTERTSPAIFGSSALVGSSNSSTSGCMASARAIATALLLPAGELLRHGMQTVGQSDAIQKRARLADGRVARLAQHMDRRLDHVLKHREMREEIELLKHGPHAATDLLELDGPCLGDPGRQPGRADGDFAAVERFQAVHAPQDGAFSGAGRADEDAHGSAFHAEVDAFEDFDRSPIA